MILSRRSDIGYVEKILYYIIYVLEMKDFDWIMKKKQIRGQKSHFGARWNNTFLPILPKFYTDFFGHNKMSNVTLVFDEFWWIVMS